MSSVALAGMGVAGLGAAEPARSEVLFPAGGAGMGGMGGAFGGGGSVGGGVYRSENNLFDCEVEGKLPADLSGIFFRIGPDPQYPKPAKYMHDIAFDGEGHISAFRIQNGHVDYRSRYVQTQRWKAQHAARSSLFGMYRNPTTDDPSVKGLSRGTANTQIFYHHGKLLAMKEDSPPVVLNPLHARYDSTTTTPSAAACRARPSPRTRRSIRRPASWSPSATRPRASPPTTCSCSPPTRAARCNWSAWIKVPYAGMIHDFGVTQKHILFYVVPLATNMERHQERRPAFRLGLHAPDLRRHHAPRRRRQGPSLVQGPELLRHAHHGQLERRREGLLGHGRR